jgi:hypothetical protein
VLSAGAIACWLLLGWRAVRARQAANIRRGPGSFRAARDSEWKWGLMQEVRSWHRPQAR